MDIKMIGKVARNRLIQDLFSAFQKQLNLSEEEISKFRHEAFLVESNEEQILKWEEFMNLEEKPDYSLQDRVDRVLFTLQSRGSFTPDFLKEQAKIFMNGIIDIEELFNEYSFTVVFKDIVGVPPNLENFRAMLELNKPAHLTYKFKFRYNTHGQLEILAHGEMEQYTHDELYQKRVFDDSQLPDGTPIVRTARFLKSIAALIFPLKTDYYNVDIFNDNFKFLDENKQNKNDNNLLTTAKNIVGAINEIFSGKANKAHSHGNSEITDIDASKIKTGTIDISRLPQAALERCVVVADDTARFKLTKSQVQVGDSVKVTSPDNLMYIVVDDTKLNQEAGYIAYSAAVKWDTIKNKPELFPPASHTHKKSEITDFAHTHDDRYYTEAEIDSKFKNLSLVPVPVGGILFMYNTSNPAELYPNTTWELLPDNKFIKTGSSPLQQAGSNSIKITKANLPTDKLQVESFNLTRGTMDITGFFPSIDELNSDIVNGAFYLNGKTGGNLGSGKPWGGYIVTFEASRSWTGSTSSASPYTTTMGSGIPISINPEHITIKAWKRTK